MQRGVDRYFEDYVKTKVKKPNGKEKTVYVYEGDFVKFDISDRARIFLKCFYVAIAAVITLLFFETVFMDIPSNVSKATGLTALFMVFPLYFLWYGSINLLIAKKEMEQRSRKAAINNTKIGALFTAIFAAISLIVDIIYIANKANTDGFVSGEYTALIYRIIMFVLAAVSVYPIFKIKLITIPGVRTKRELEENR